MRIIDKLLRRDARLARRIAAGIELNKISPARDRNGWDDIAAFARETDRVYLDGGNWMCRRPDGVSQIMCPRCWNGGGGVLSPIRPKGSDEVFYLCDECDATWPVDQFDWRDCTVAFEDRSQALARRGLAGGDWEDA
jgi:hypothetical protein